MAVPKIKITIINDVSLAGSIIAAASDKGIEQSMALWEAQAKALTTEERHVVTGRYRGSINQSKGSPPNYVDGNYSPNNDGIHERKGHLHWIGGSNVEYASELEKKYSLMARGLDSIRNDIADIIARAILLATL